MTGHLIHIGYPKTGSNFLRRWFAKHPQLAYVEGGIGGFSSVIDIARKGVTPPDEYLWRVTSAEGLAAPHLDIGADLIDYDRMRRRPMPAAQASVCAMLASTFPNAHILIVTRGFRSMILSAYSQYVRTGGEDSFDRFCGLTREGGETGQDAWGYAWLIGLYREAFHGRVITLPYELLRDSPAGFTRELEQRLGICHQDNLPARQNPSLSPVELAWYPRLTRAVRALPIGGRLRRRVEARYLRLAMSNRLAALVALFQRLRPAEPVTDAILSDAMVGAWSGRSEPFRGDPLYAPYANDYLL